MAQTGLCDSRPLLDLHKKLEERLAPLRTWANSCSMKERWPPVEGEEARELHGQTDPEPQRVRRLPLSAEDGIIMGYVEQTASAHPGVVCEEAALLRHLHSLQALPSPRELQPALLCRDLEQAMSSLGLTHDPSYAWDVFSDMLRSQLHCTLPSASLPWPFTDTTRAVLVDWLIQVHEVFNFSEETLYLAVHLLNRALRQVQVSIASLQLLGVVCLFLAAKREECLLPEVSELCYLMENGYSRRQLLRMERRVLTGLQFQLSYCPPLHFLFLAASISCCSDKVVWMAHYLLELTLLEGRCVVFLPTLLAAAAMRLARRVLQEPPSPESDAAWCMACGMHMGSEATLFSIMQIMAVAAATAQSRETRATFLKFSTSTTLYISLHPALKSAPCLFGMQCPQT